MLNALETTSTRPYLIRALYEWCTDNGFTPYVAVLVDGSVRVPLEYVKNGEIVLNVSFDATSSLSLGNEFIEFNARFAGTSREIKVPIGRVIAIYARENGQGMAFPAPTAAPAGDAGIEGPTVSSDTLANAPDPGRVVQLVAVDGSQSTTSVDPPSGLADQPDPTPPRPPAGSGRPALKRIK